MHLKRVFISAEVQIVKKNITIHAKQWERKFNFAIKISTWKPLLSLKEKFLIVQTIKHYYDYKNQYDF